MSRQRSIQKSNRLISSAPNKLAPEKHVNFREIHSAEPKGGYEYQPSTATSSTRNESLFLEDHEDSVLQKNSNTLSSDSFSASNSPDSAYSQSFYRLPEDLLARGDFIAYQGANVSEFFNSTNHQRPKRISEICLVNDHYILVKIPPTNWWHEGAMDTIAEEEGSLVENREQRKGFLRYFPCQRNRRVLPATSVKKSAEPTSSAAYSGKTGSILSCPLTYCWRVNENPEVFESRTKIFGVFWKQKIPGKVITIQPTSKNDSDAPLDLRVKSVNIAENGGAVGENNNQIETGVFGTPLNALSTVETLPAIGGPLQTSLHDVVTLEQHATWVNGNNAEDFKQFVNHEKSSLADNKNAKLKRRTNVFHWFQKRPKATKSKPKIRAVVYKTYFVRWKKPPGEGCPHCGRAKDDAVSGTARCHSATF